MTYKQFKFYMDKIRAMQVAGDKIDKTLKLLDSSNFFIMGNFEDSFVALLEHTMNDRGENISYFIYELDWGKTGKNCIKEKDGTKVSLRTYKELYNYINSQ